jgi:hypothetical protein
MARLRLRPFTDHRLRLDVLDRDRSAEGESVGDLIRGAQASLVGREHRGGTGLRDEMGELALAGAPSGADSDEARGLTRDERSVHRRAVGKKYEDPLTSSQPLAGESAGDGIDEGVVTGPVDPGTVPDERGFVGSVDGVGANPLAQSGGTPEASGEIVGFAF